MGAPSSSALYGTLITENCFYYGPTDRHAVNAPRAAVHPSRIYITVPTRTSLFASLERTDITGHYRSRRMQMRAQYPAMRAGSMMLAFFPSLCILHTIVGGWNVQLCNVRHARR